MENKHLAGDLKIMQSLPLHIKIDMTEYRIRQWYENYGGDVYVSFSGGKDSTVLLDIARSIYPDIPAVFVDTGLEFPEIKQFVRSFENVTTLRPDISFREVLKKYGYPVVSKAVAHAIDVARRNPNGKLADLFKRDDGLQYDMSRWKLLLDSDFPISNKCCDVMKKDPAKKYIKATGKMPIVATLAEESELRKTAWIKNGCNAFDIKNPRSAPMSFWTEQDVLCYIHDKKLPIASVYGQIAKDDKGHFYTTGETRTGCIFCMFGAHCERGEGRFQRLKRTHPKLWEYCMRDYDAGGLGLRHVCEVCGIRTGDEIKDDGQTTIEEYLNEK